MRSNDHGGYVMHKGFILFTENVGGPIRREIVVKAQPLLGDAPITITSEARSAIPYAPERNVGAAVRKGREELRETIDDVHESLDRQARLMESIQKMRGGR